MSSFDFSLYDPTDKIQNPTLTSSAKTKQKQNKNTQFDFDAYEISEKTPPQNEQKSFLDTADDYVKTILKGSAEGISRFGKILGPLQDYQGKTAEQEFQEQTQVLDKYLPVEEDYAQSSIRRGLRDTPTMIAMGGGLQALPRSIAAGFAGEGAQELGLPEWAQTAAEMTAYLSPDVTKKLLSKGANKEIVEAAKKMGLTDEQITPLIQSEFKQKWLSKLTPKIGSTEEKLANTQAGLESAYRGVQDSQIAKGELSQVSKENLFGEFLDKLKDMPAGARDLIKQDLEDLLSNKITGKSLINFYKDINFNLSGKTKQLATLKEPIKKALSEISPELGKDFEMVNALYSKYYPIASKLKPTLTDKIVRAGEALGVLGTLTLGTMGHGTPIAALIGIQGAKKLSQMLLTNPRFQQISQKTIEAMNSNKYGVVKKLADSFKSQLKEDFPEVAEKLGELSENEIKEFLSQETE